MNVERKICVVWDEFASDSFCCVPRVWTIAYYQRHVKWATSLPSAMAIHKGSVKYIQKRVLECNNNWTLIVVALQKKREERRGDKKFMKMKYKKAIIIIVFPHTTFTLFG
jgi:hypothetical protein